MEKRRDAASKKAEDVRKANPKQPGDVGRNSGSNNNITVTQQQQQHQANVNAAMSKLSREQLQALMKSGKSQEEIEKELQAMGLLQVFNTNNNNKTQELHSRRMPEVTSQVSSSTTKQVLSELANAVDEERRCSNLKQDVDNLLSAPVPDVEDVFEAIGEAQSDDEKILRQELGDSVFVRVIEILLTLSVTKAENEKKALETELNSLLGAKVDLLPQLQQISMQFGLEE
jgi:hypothetical protein